MKWGNEPSFPEEILEEEEEINLGKWVGPGTGRAWSVTEKIISGRGKDVYHLSKEMMGTEGQSN